MRIGGPLVALALVAGSLAVPVAPAATPITLPFTDAFDSDSIASGVWERTQVAPVTSTIANGDLTLTRTTPSIGAGGGGIRRPWTPTNSDVILEAHVTPRTVYRFGIGLTSGNSNVFLEGDDLGWLLAYENAQGQRQFANLGVGPVPNVEHFVRLVLRVNGQPYAEVWDAAQTTRLGSATGGAVAGVTPANAQFALLAVWRDRASDPMSSYVVHDYAVGRLDPKLQARGTPGYEVDGVQPDGGTPKTTFTFETTATGFLPSVVQVFVDGVPKFISPTGPGSAIGGRHFRGSMQLGPFLHTYHFEATDGVRTARFPVAGEFTILVGPLEGEREAPLMFVPGFNPGAFLSDGEIRDVEAYFDDFDNTLAENGWNVEDAIFWGYYMCDRGNADEAGEFRHVDGYGAPVAPQDFAPHVAGNDNRDGRSFFHNHQGARADCGVGVNGHDKETSIKHLAYHWAWAVSTYEATNGYPCVKVVAHSMGGAIVRYAIAAVQHGWADFPPHLCVDSVVTLGSPHSPGSLVPGVCSSGADLGFTRLRPYSCQEMDGDVTFYDQLADAIGHNPQGTLPLGTSRGTTNWTVIGSDGDQTIEMPHTLSMLGAANRVAYRDNALDHNEFFDPAYTHRVPNAHTSGWVRGTPFDLASSPTSVYWTDKFLALGDWGCGVVGAPMLAPSYFPLPRGVAITGEPVSAGTACGYEIVVPPDSTFRIRFASPSHARSWTVTFVDEFGEMDVCTRGPETWGTCTRETTIGGTFRIEVDLMDPDGSTTVVPFLLDATW